MLRQTGQCFLLYSFLGWLLEGLFNLTKEGSFQKPNFLHGPVKPMYGVAGVLLTAGFKYDRRHFAWYSWVLPLLVEYISAWWLEHRYALKYWDYSREPMQIDGRICLKFALCWVILAQLVVHVVHPFIKRMLRVIGRMPVWKSLFRLFFADCIVTMHQRRKRCLLRNHRNYIKSEA